MVKKVFELTLLICLGSGVAHGASFDCNKASTRSEKIICSDSKLSSADERLAKVYKEALAASADKEALRHEQKEWLASERDVCATVACMLDAYLARIGQLEKIPGGAATASNSTTRAAPILVIQAVPENPPNALERNNAPARQAVEVTGTIEFGHDAAGGNYFVDGGKKKQYTLGYVRVMDDATQEQLSKLADSHVKVTVRGTLAIWKDGSAAFDNSQPINIFK
jgi:uncharacterized protein